MHAANMAMWFGPKILMLEENNVYPSKKGPVFSTKRLSFTSPLFKKQDLFKSEVKI